LTVEVIGYGYRPYYGYAYWNRPYYRRYW